MKRPGWRAGDACFNLTKSPIEITIGVIEREKLSHRYEAAPKVGMLSSSPGHFDHCQIFYGSKAITKLSRPLSTSGKRKLSLA